MTKKIPEYRSPWDCPAVRQALLERPPHDVSLLCCPRCYLYSAYNEGSHWRCTVEGCGRVVLFHDYEDRLGMDEPITLFDYEGDWNYASGFAAGGEA